MNRLNKPVITRETFREMEDMSFFIHAKIFDDLLIIAQKQTNCFVLKTNEGLIVIDAIWPAKEAFEAIVDAIKDAGWNPDTIKKLVLTHGYVDTYLSEVDDNFWKEHPTKPDRPETWKDYKIDTYIHDGDTITLGDKTIS